MTARSTGTDWRAEALGYAAAFEREFLSHVATRHRLAATERELSEARTEARAAYRRALSDLRRELAPVAVAVIALESGAYSALRDVALEAIGRLEARL